MLIHDLIFVLQIFEIMSLDGKIEIKNEPMPEDVTNPWLVNSIQAFIFLKCPECIFDTQEEDIFQEHAIERHPLSIVFFANSKIYKEEQVDCTIEEHGVK